MTKFVKKDTYCVDCHNMMYEKVDLTNHETGVTIQCDFVCHDCNKERRRILDAKLNLFHRQENCIFCGKRLLPVNMNKHRYRFHTIHI